MDKKSLESLFEGPCEMMANGEDAEAVIVHEQEDPHLPQPEDKTEVA